MVNMGIALATTSGTWYHWWLRGLKSACPGEYKLMATNFFFSCLQVNEWMNEWMNEWAHPQNCPFRKCYGNCLGGGVPPQRNPHNILGTGSVGGEFIHFIHSFIRSSNCLRVMAAFALYLVVINSWLAMPPKTVSISFDWGSRYAASPYSSSPNGIGCRMYTVVPSLGLIYPDCEMMMLKSNDKNVKIE